MMNILLTNDDGYDAEGLAAAYEALCPLGRVNVVAPAAERSGCSHSISLHEPIMVERLDHPSLGIVYSVHGTPADCVRLALGELLREPVDLVVSGINRGSNTGVDTFYSGTIAGAREAAILGIASIAVSHAVRRDVPIDWKVATRVTTDLVRKLHSEKLPGPGFWSVNLPAPIPADPLNHLHRVPVAMEEIPLAFKQIGQTDGKVWTYEYGKVYWDRKVSEPSDFSVVRDGGIAISALSLVG